jgi:hypothetical protein
MQLSLLYLPWPPWSAQQIEIILIAKASMEDNISLQYRRRYDIQTLPMYTSLKQHYLKLDICVSLRWLFSCTGDPGEQVILSPANKVAPYSPLMANS